MTQPPALMLKQTGLSTSGKQISRVDTPTVLLATDWVRTTLVLSLETSIRLVPKVSSWSISFLKSNKAHIVASLLFAATHNLKLRVKNTGHTLTGQSQGTGSFAIYTHNLKDIKFVDNFVPSGSKKGVGSAVTYQAGVQFYELYPAADEAGVIVIGGSCDSVGGAGGYWQGGGHSHLTPHYGLGLDNVLEFTLITVTGAILKVNANTYPDLWWAVRGGGGGTWGVIFDVTYKTHPALKNMLAINYQYTIPNTDLYEASLKSWIDLTPTMRDYGMTDISAADRTALVILGTVFLPNVTDVSAVDEVFAPIYQFASDNNVTFTTTYNLYDTYWDMVKNEPLATRPGGHEDAVVSAARLAPRSAYANTTALAKFLAALPATYMFDTPGGKATEFSVDSASVNPAWRGANGAIAEYIWYEGWTNAGPASEQIAVRQGAVEKLKTLTEIIGSDAVYSNEANPDEDYFPHNFWGSNYDRLLQIKKKYDPKRLLTCNVCVGWNGY
ncbi:FAD-binding domain-containing protein [Atractiella rhizophila]|nr:FAD-binding domain-containing protein [Atractiella rhizophila]